MKKEIDFGAIIFLIILMIGVCGCTMNNSNLPNSTESKVCLSQRQKDILLAQDLPTEYKDLSISQQRAIVAIENMLCYVEEKYNTSFSYAGYIAASTLEKEHMRAFPTSGDIEVDSFTITRTDDGYEDDFINIITNTKFTSYICESLKSLAPNTEIKVFTEITETFLLEVPTNNADFDGKVESSLWIFVDKATFAEQNLNNFKVRFTTFMKEHELYGITQIVLLREGKIAYLTRYNYTDYLSDDYYVSREMVYIN